MLGILLTHPRGLEPPPPGFDLYECLDHEGLIVLSGLIYVFVWSSVFYWFFYLKNELAKVQLYLEKYEALRWKKLNQTGC
jgi:hypothetical protein